MRYNPVGSIFDQLELCCFVKDSKDIYYLQGFLNSKIAYEMLKVLAPTMAFNPGSVGKLPIIKNYKEYDNINKYVKHNINIARNNWDSFETSLDFKKHPIIEFKTNNIENSFKNWSVLQKNNLTNLNQMKKN